MLLGRSYCIWFVSVTPSSPKLGTEAAGSGHFRRPEATGSPCVPGAQVEHVRMLVSPREAAFVTQASWSAAGTHHPRKSLLAPASSGPNALLGLPWWLRP